VVARLFGLVQPSIAVFGQKDFQQLAVIRQMTQDLALPVQIIGAPIVREADGLALSSRNVYLSQDDRERALSISRSLKTVQQAIWNGECTAETLREQIQSELTVDRVDYIEFVHSTTLRPVLQVDNETRLLIAAFLGSTRLIDNTALTLEKSL
jgi:pantoate--beta-alanine ligase